MGSCAAPFAFARGVLRSRRSARGVVLLLLLRVRVHPALHRHPHLHLLPVDGHRLRLTLSHLALLRMVISHPSHLRPRTASLRPLRHRRVRFDGQAAPAAPPPSTARRAAPAAWASPRPRTSFRSPPPRRAPLPAPLAPARGLRARGGAWWRPRSRATPAFSSSSRLLDAGDPAVCRLSARLARRAIPAGDPDPAQSRRARGPRFAASSGPFRARLRLRANHLAHRVLRARSAHRRLHGGNRRRRRRRARAIASIMYASTRPRRLELHEDADRHVLREAREARGEGGVGSGDRRGGGARRRRGRGVPLEVSAPPV